MYGTTVSHYSIAEYSIRPVPPYLYLETAYRPTWSCRAGCLSKGSSSLFPSLVSRSPSSSLLVLLLPLLPPLVVVVVVVVNTPCYPRVVSLLLLPPLVHLFIPIATRSICAINLSSPSSCALRPSYHHPQSRRWGSAIFLPLSIALSSQSDLTLPDSAAIISIDFEQPAAFHCLPNRSSHSCRQGTLLPLLSSISTSRNCTFLTSPHSFNICQPFSNLHIHKQSYPSQPLTRSKALTILPRPVNLGV